MYTDPHTQYRLAQIHHHQLIGAAQHTHNAKAARAATVPPAGRRWRWTWTPRFSRASTSCTSVETAPNSEIPVPAPINIADRAPDAAAMRAGATGSEQPDLKRIPAPAATSGTAKALDEAKAPPRDAQRRPTPAPAAGYHLAR